MESFLDILAPHVGSCVTVTARISRWWMANPATNDTQAKKLPYMFLDNFKKCFAHIDECVPMAADIIAETAE